MEPQRRYWIGFNLVRGIGPARTRSLLEHFGSLESAWSAQQHELKRAGLGEKLASKVVQFRQKVDLDEVCDNLDRSQIQVLTWLDADYPRRLLDIDHPPPVLYLRGTLHEQDMWAVAIVGTRRATTYGRQTAAELAAFLASNGITVVSGFARGVDTVAHRAAVKAGGRTIAVLGCGVEQVYPPENRHLVDEMIESGLGVLVSDYPVGTPPEGQNFPPRNRIISGLSLASVVIEAGERSGALITAHFALDQGREVLAVPGNIKSPNSAGTNKLISKGAHPYLKPENVLEILEWVRVVQYPEKKRAVPSPGLEKQLYEKLKNEAAHIDELSVILGLSVDKISSALTIMEIKGLVRQVDGLKYFSV